MRGGGGGGGGGGGKKASLPKICHTYPIMMEFGAVIPYLILRRSKNYMNHVTLPISCADISIFYLKSANFAISKNANIDSI